MVLFVMGALLIYAGSWGASGLEVGIALVGILCWVALIFMDFRRGIPVLTAVLGLACCCPILASLYVSIGWGIDVRHAVPVGMILLVFVLIFGSLKISTP